MISKSMSQPEGVDDRHFRLQVLDMVFRMSDNESDRMWKRFGLLLAVNAALLAFVRISVESGNGLEPEIYLSSGVFGLFTCLFWYWIMKMSMFYIGRWTADAKAIIEEDNQIKEWIKGRGDEPRVDRPAFPKIQNGFKLDYVSASHFAIGIVVLLAILWTIVLSYGGGLMMEVF